jgi:hypothetical protein
MTEVKVYPTGRISKLEHLEHLIAQLKAKRADIEAQLAACETEYQRALDELVARRDAAFAKRRGGGG